MRRLDLAFSEWETSRMISARVGACSSIDQPLVADRYRIDERVGSGSYGFVYRAWDTVLDRAVAVKTGAPHIVSEARALARLRHPNAVIIYDHGVDDDCGYIVMEMLSGQTLRQWRESEPRDLAQIMRVYIEAGRGLAAAHQAGVVHRDFKPDNVIVTRSGRVVVVDFGVATSIGEDDSRAAGTLRYMAPEQVIAGGRVGPASDQFGFCVALWEAITGEAPFPSGDIRERLERCIIGPTGTEPPMAVGNILRCGLAASPVSRWPSMNALLSALERATERVKRRPVMIAAVVVVAIVSLGMVPMGPCIGIGSAADGVPATDPGNLGELAVTAAELGDVDGSLSLLAAARRNARSPEELAHVADLADEVGLELYRRSEWRAAEEAHAFAHDMHLASGQDELALRSLSLMSASAGADQLAQ